MFSLFWASLLTLPTTVGPTPRALQRPLPAPRFHYTLGALTRPATAPTRTLWVKPTQGNHPTQSNAFPACVNAKCHHMHLHDPVGLVAS
ncbi:hypothetical protein [Hymenobacter defluvii]|uniref:Secreted protein n=1 Tax=Hymenobacter defluvii TaxID=2054411 RepID=A0ABS3TI77_9BACT|nr:hypothetical protein [Hymenobacter defluvii]MBO3273369.1 hypothetical protein [Hymenobacter defluvii]